MNGNDAEGIKIEIKPREALLSWSLLPLRRLTEGKKKSENE